jgi:hypothetical protein
VHRVADHFLSIAGTTALFRSGIQTSVDRKYVSQEDADELLRILIKLNTLEKLTEDEKLNFRYLKVTFYAAADRGKRESCECVHLSAYIFLSFMCL